MALINYTVCTSVCSCYKLVDKVNYNLVAALWVVTKPGLWTGPWTGPWIQ